MQWCWRRRAALPDVAKCAWSLGAEVPDVQPCALWNLGAGGVEGAAARCVAVHLELGRWRPCAAGRRCQICALELACWCRCRMPLPDVWPCALWSWGAGAVAGCSCQMCALELGR